MIAFVFAALRDAHMIAGIHDMRNEISDMCELAERFREILEICLFIIADWFMHV